MQSGVDDIVKIFSFEARFENTKPDPLPIDLK